MEDEEISKELTRLFKKRGINMIPTRKVEEVGENSGWGYTNANGKAQMEGADEVLVAVGRLPLTENVGVEKTKIELEVCIS